MNSSESYEETALQRKQNFFSSMRYRLSNLILDYGGLVVPAAAGFVMGCDNINESARGYAVLVGPAVGFVSPVSQWVIDEHHTTSLQENYRLSWCTYFQLGRNFCAGVAGLSGANMYQNFNFENALMTAIWGSLATICHLLNKSERKNLETLVQNSIGTQKSENLI